jgi:hypothetical protein
VESRGERIARELLELPAGERRKVFLEISERLRIAADPGLARRKVVVAVVGIVVPVVAAILFTTFMPARGWVELTTDPADATVRVDGQPPANGRSPFCIGDTKGRHTLVVSRPGYVESKQAIVIAAGETLKKKVVLAVMEGNGFELLSEPPGAEVWLDGSPIKNDAGKIALTNFRTRKIAPGIHDLELKGYHFLPWRHQLNIEPGRIEQVHAWLEYQREPSF